MASKFDRVNFQPIIVPLDGGTDYPDFLSSSYLNIVKYITTSRIHVVTQDEEANLQLISYNYYKTISLWWIIGMYNGIINPFFEVVAGTYINIPDLVSIETYIRNQSASQAGVISLP